MKLHNELRLTIRQHQAKFGSHTSSGVRNNWFLGCYVNLCDQVVRRPTLVAKRDRKGDILFLICHVTSCDQKVRGLCDIIDEFP